MANTEPTIRLLDYLPEVYQNILPGLFRTEIPRETRATCDDCAMCGPEGTFPSELDLKSFHPDIKCCTYHPSLPNYLVGAILVSREPGLDEGKRRIRAKLAAGLGVSPRGVLAPRKYSLFYDNTAEFFGRSPAMVCPYYDKGNCSIWLHREAVCTTYFCKYVRGEQGKALWTELKRYLGTIEFKLSLHCLSELEKDPAQRGRLWDLWDAKGPLTVEDLSDAPPSEAQRKAVWGRWRGREEEFYLSCHEIVGALDPETFGKIVGIDETFLRGKVETTLRKAASREIPPRLKRNPELCVVKRGDAYLVTSAGARGEAFELSSLFYPLLDKFDGEKDNAELRRECSGAFGVLIPEDLLAFLYHRGILIEA